MLRGHRDLAVAELTRDVAELHAGREELRGEGVAQVLEAELGEPGSVADPPPLPAVEVRGVEPIEDEDVVARTSLVWAAAAILAVEERGQAEQDADRCHIPCE